MLELMILTFCVLGRFLERDLVANGWVAEVGVGVCWLWRLNSSVCAAISGLFSSMWSWQIQECFRQILFKQENLLHSFLLMISLGAKHCGQYCASLAILALSAKSTFFHCGELPE